MLASTAFAAEKAPEANAPLNPYEQIMVGKVWVTTDAVDLSLIHISEPTRH